MRTAPASQWRGGCSQGEGWQMCVDSVSSRQGKPRAMRLLSALKQSTLRGIGSLYRYTPLVVLAMTMAIILTRVRRMTSQAIVPLLLAVACIGGVFVRAVMLAWVDVVSFPSMLPQYSHASYVLLLLGMVFLAISAAYLNKTHYVTEGLSRH